MNPAERALEAMEGCECEMCDNCRGHIVTLRAALERGGRGHVQNCGCHRDDLKRFFGYVFPCSVSDCKGKHPYRDPRCEAKPEPPALSDAEKK